MKWKRGDYIDEHADGSHQWYIVKVNHTSYSVVWSNEDDCVKSAFDYVDFMANTLITDIFREPRAK